MAEMRTMVNRLHNFSAGPCTLPLEVLEEARDQLVEYGGTGMGLIEMSHRSKQVQQVHGEAVELVRELLELPEGYHVLFLGGGATYQFTMVPMNLLHGGGTADYVHSGAWAKKAIADAKLLGRVNVAWSGEGSGFTTLPDPAEVRAGEGSAYLHLTSNETIGGVQWRRFPEADVPLVADMSSDILSRPIPVERFGLIYAGAQKNIGPAGVALVVIREDVLERCPRQMPAYLNYHGHVEAGGMLNTPPVFQVWMVALVLRWLKARGGVAWARRMAEQRSAIVYGAIERNGGFYRCPVEEAARSTMNVVWRLPSEELEARFLREAEEAGMSGLKGHRSVGGCRASIYNAMPVEGAEHLAQFMDEFARKHG